MGMWSVVSNWIKKLGGPSVGAKDPDGDAIIKLLFNLPDPMDFEVPLSLGSVLAGPGVIGQPTPLQQQRARREIYEKETGLYFVAKPAAMKALRDKGHIQKNASGVECAVYNNQMIPFFGYADAPMDEEHWGVDLRRIKHAELAQKELHALQEVLSEAQEAREGQWKAGTKDQESAGESVGRRAPRL